VILTTLELPFEGALLISFIFSSSVGRSVYTFAFLFFLHSPPFIYLLARFVRLCFTAGLFLVLNWLFSSFLCPSDLHHTRFSLRLGLKTTEKAFYYRVVIGLQIRSLVFDSRLDFLAVKRDICKIESTASR
jgi:hypothetical protein